MTDSVLIKILRGPDENEYVTVCDLNEEGMKRSGTILLHTINPSEIDNDDEDDENEDPPTILLARLLAFDGCLKCAPITHAIDAALTAVWQAARRR